MRIDGITLLEGSKATNLTIASGTTYPSNPDLGEMFFRTDLDEVHVYASTGWEALAGGGGGGTAYTAGTGLTLSGTTFSLTTPVASANLGSGTANSTTFLRGDGTWATPAGTTYTAGTGLTLSGTTFSLSTPVAPANLGSGTANSTTFLRGDGTWATVPGSGSITGAVNDTATTSGVYAGSKDGYGALFVVNGSAPANARKIKLYQGSSAGAVYLSLTNDADTTETQILRINRSGNTATSTELTTGTLQLVGQASVEGTWTANVASNNVRLGTNADGGIVSFSSSTAAVGNKLSYFMVDQAGSLLYRLANDTNSSQTTVFEIDRSGNTATAAFLNATTISLNGAVRVQQATFGTNSVPASNVDCSLGNFFTKAVSGNMTWTVSNVPTGRFYSFILQLSNGGAGTITWFPGTRWAGGTAPTLTLAGVDILGFYTEDGGANWRGVVLALDSK